MKRFALVLLLLARPAWAQPPEVIQSEDRIELGIGESKTLRFHEPFKSFDTATPDVIKFLPQSDKQLTVTGAALGTTLMFIHDENENVIYTATISVLPASGHLVKLYGKRGVKDFVGWYCNDTGCGRADLDKKLANGGRDPDDPSVVSVTRPLPGGGSTTSTFDRN